MSSIKRIKDNDVHRICSGQVVLSLAVAVKELVENALDAGATVIEIRLKEHGKELIEVIDNGSGIMPDNFEALALKHCTSKISEFSDLESVGTFGFRGEALSSLCALSDLTVVTRHASQSVASRLTYDTCGILQRQEPCAREAGTSVCLSKLFHTLPVRYKEFQRNLKKEYAKLIQLLQSYCLISTNVKILCYNQTSSSRTRQLVLSAGPNANIKDNILNVFGSKQLKHIVEIVQKDSSEYQDDSIGEDEAIAFHPDIFKMFRLTGYISRCNHGCGRSTNDRQFYFINNRPFDHLKLARAVNEVYHLYNRHQQPFVILCINLDHGFVDVNVTPDKRQILIQQERALIALTKMVLKDIFDPMQSEYELQSVNAPTVSHDSIAVSHDLNSSLSQDGSEVVKSNNVETTKLCGLKRSFMYHGGTSNITSYKKAPQSTQKSLKEFGVCVKTSRKFCLHDNSHKGLVNVDNEEDHSSSHDISVICDEGTENSSVSVINDNTAIPQQRNATSDCVEVDKEQQYSRDCKGKYKLIDFNAEVTRQRFEHKLKHDITQYGNTRRHGFRAKITPESNEAAVGELRREIKKDMFAQMQVIGQFNLGFIICKLGTDLFIVDQHASDEKYNFERLQRETTLKHQKLLQPLSLELTAVNEDIVTDNIEVFRKNGFEFSIDKEASPTKRVKLVGQPVSKDWSLGPSDIDEMIFMLSDAPGQMCRPSRVSAMFASRACRSSIMIGTSLNNSEMKKILVHMGEIEQPWNCPHGRPTMRHLVDMSLIDNN